MVIWSVVDETASDPADRVVASFVNEDEALAFARYTSYIVLANQLKGDVTKLEPWDTVKYVLDEYRSRRSKRHAFRQVTVHHGRVEAVDVEEVYDRR